MELSSIPSLLTQYATIGGGLWALWGVIVLAGALKDKNGPQLQAGVWQIVGGFLIITAAQIFNFITSGGGFASRLQKGGISDMQNVILGLFEWLIELLDFSGTASSMLGGTLSSLMPGFYSIATALSTSAIMPLAYTVLALFMLLELAKVSVRVESAGGGFQTGAEAIFKVLLKMALCKLVLDNTPQLLTAIHNTFGSLIGGLSGSVSGSVDLSAIQAEIEGIGLFDGLAIFIFSFLCILVAGAAFVITQIIIMARAVEIYLFVAVAPLPLATLPNEEMSGIGKNFLKNFAAVGLQGILLWLVLQFLPQIFSNVGFGGHVGIYWTILGIIAQSITIIGALTSTGRIAKSILQAS